MTFCRPKPKTKMGGKCFVDHILVDMGTQQKLKLAVRTADVPSDRWCNITYWFPTSCSLHK